MVFLVKDVKINQLVFFRVCVKDLGQMTNEADFAKIKPELQMAYS